MRFGSLLLASLVSVGLFTSNNAASAAEPKGDVSCDCEQSSCGPCEVETGTSFYSAKCGPGLSRVKSCKKVACEPVEDQPACLALFKKESGSKTESVPKVSDSNDKGRDPASVAHAPAGEIVDVLGSGRVLRAHGGKETARKGLPVYENDVVETSKDGKVKVALKDDNDPKLSSELVLTPDSRIRIESVKAESPKGPRDVMLKLLAGKLRSRVNKKTPGEITFRVKTTSAVAGVRGTDFVTTFTPGNEKWRTEVSTFGGLVQLEGGVPRKDGSPAKSIDVTPGTHAAFEIAAPPSGADDKMIATYVSEGDVTPLLLIQPDDMKLLDDATDLKPFDAAKAAEAQSRKVASSGQSDSVCQEPAGQYNQCSWTCEGNPKGEKKCRTDLPNVSCVRRLCRASGLWVEPKRLPASQSDACLPDKPVVRDCGAYW